MLSIKRLALLLSLFVPVSCSIKEDRSDCPCCLGLDYSECMEKVEGLVLMGWEDKYSTVFRDNPGNGHLEGYREYSVPRCDFTVLAVSGSGGTKDKCLLVDRGCQADSIYASIDNFSTRCEYCFRKLALQKQFATLRLITEMPPEGEWTLSVESGTAGMSLETLAGIPGDFEFKPKETAPGVFEVRLFRQCDDNLTLAVSSPGIFGGGRNVDLAELLSRCDYDWTEVSLRDIDVMVDNSFCKMTIIITNWNEKKEITVEI